MSLQKFSWTPAELLAQNRQNLLAELKRELRMYEARYEISSDRLEEELKAGRIRDTAEICNWMIAIQTYRAVQSES